MDLIPEIGDEFTLKQIKIISLRFKTDDKGQVIGLELYEPDAVYEAKRIKD
jgi:hypothetical protein